MKQLMSGSLPEKKIENNCVAILHSSGGNVGWYTEHGIYNLIFDRDIVEMIMRPFNPDIVLDYCQRKYGLDSNYKGIPYLRIEWVPVGSMIYLQLDDNGNETVVTWDHIRSQSIQA
jgi:hypothetical protein